MNKFSKNYFITLEGNDLDVKNVQKLKTGDKLKLGRVEDGEDTFEITVSTQADKMIDLLAYCDSVGVAPFMDEGSVTVESAIVDKVDVKPGKSRAKDRTTLYFTVEYSYDELLVPYTGESGVFGFIPDDDIVLATAVHSVVDSGSDIVMNQPYLNMYDMEKEITQQLRPVFADMGLKDDTRYRFYCRVLFDEKFEKCRVWATILSAEDEIELELSQLEKQSALTFVNHLRIFGGETPVDPVVE